jgi:ribose transport system substrate-binding protein
MTKEEEGMTRRVRKFIALAAVVPVIAGVAACGDDEPSSATAAKTSDKKPKVTLELALQSGCAFCMAIQNGAEAAAEEHGVDLTAQSPPKPETGSQVQQLQAVAATKPDVIIVEPFDANALVAPVKQIVSGGAKAIMVDTDIADASARMSLITSDNVKGGELAAEAVNEATGGEGKVMYMGYTPGATAVDDRKKGFDEALEQYSGLTQVKPQYAIDDAAAVAPKVSATLKAHPDLKAIFASTEAAAIGTVNALRAAKKEGEIKVIAYDGAPAEVEALERGAISTLIVQGAYDMGRIAVEQAAEYVKSGTTPTEKTMVDFVVATKDNLDDPKVKQYLYPAE